MSGALLLGCGPEQRGLTLQWAPPSENEDGSRLEGLAGYRLYWWHEETGILHEAELGDPSVTSYRFEDLPDGRWRVGVAAVTEEGLQSELNAVSVTIEDGGLIGKPVELGALAKEELADGGTAFARNPIGAGEPDSRTRPDAPER